MKRRRHHVGPLRRLLRFWDLVDVPQPSVLSARWMNRRGDELRHRLRAVRARSRAAALNQVGGPQTQQGN